MYHRNQVVELRITDYSFGGRGVAKIENEEGSFIVFVDNTFPGQLVTARIDKKKKKYAEAKLIDIIERSPIEQVDRFQEISGGPYIYVPIQEQEKFKKITTLEIFKRLARIPDIEDKFDEFISSPSHYFYRNKMEYSFSCIEYDPQTKQDIDDSFALGFKRRGTWWKVEDLKKPCGLFDEEWETILPEITAKLKATGLTAWHPPQKSGFYRHIVVRKSFHTNQLLINLVTSSEGIEQFNAEGIASFLVEKLGNRLAGFQHTINDNVADRAKIENGQSKLLYGEPKVVEQLLGLSFEISMESFFQTNPACAELLYTKALDYVFDGEIQSNEIIMDLFCGTGTIGQILTTRKNDVKIVGVDIVQEAIDDAKENAKRNGISNIEFYAADVGKFLKEYPHYQGKIKTIILDPPRAGIAPKTLQKVIDLGATNLVYVSCNPSTQARDTETLMKAGYTLEKLSFVDQFPHTGHIESVARFIKN